MNRPLITANSVEKKAENKPKTIPLIYSNSLLVINGRFILRHRASVISFYEFVSGVIFLTVFLMAMGHSFNPEFFTLQKSDWIYLLILASVCTAYAFIGAVEVMRYISPFTVILSYNLEPIYGIALALLFFPESEIMSAEFYMGAALVLMTVLLDAYIKYKDSVRRKRKVVTD
jgi:drug/metabolite transporter (DMT)-like permease